MTYSTSLINSIQRQIRLLGKDNCEHVLVFTKVLKIAISESKRNKYEKIQQLAEKFKTIDAPYFAPTKYVKFDETLLQKLADFIKYSTKGIKKEAVFKNSLFFIFK